MSKLTDFYTHKASLLEERKPFDPQWEMLEDQLLKEELLPELIEQLKSVLSKVKSPLMGTHHRPNSTIHKRRVRTRQLMRKVLGTLALSLLLLSCQNKSRKDYSNTLEATHSEESYQLPDTTVTEEVKEQDEVKVPETPTTLPPSRSHKSSGYPSRSHRSSGYDNMRGFDPASEDDMDDNGMSRYMENNDDEGWD